MRIEPRSIDEFSDVWVYKEFLPEDLYKTIEAYLFFLDDSVSNNYEGRKISLSGKTYSLIGTSGYRPYRKIFQLNEIEGYWNQTEDSIYNWASNNYRKIIPPVLRFLGEKILDLDPFKGKKFIISRGIYNILEPGKSLDIHIDHNMYCSKGDTWSSTYYINVDGEGGEFYDIRGLFYKPSNNSLLINKGNIEHGVAPSSKKRLGITLRFDEPSNLILPGSIDALLYKPS